MSRLQDVAKRARVSVSTVSNVNEEKVREMEKIGHHWKNPVWRTASGVVTEW
jgi:DNA-binding LacI/PurR family transcriptional regulator